MSLPSLSPPAPAGEAAGLSRLARLAPWLVVAVAVLPVLAVDYLPMTDAPQHLAITSILAHYDDPAFGFAEYYRLALGETLYVLPYGLMLLVGKWVPLALALRLVTAAALAVYLLGIHLLLRAMGKPWPLLLLAIPFVYNRAFFWGFLNFYWGVGLAIVALALSIAAPRALWKEVAAALLLVASAFCHVYGLALYLGYMSLWALTRERRALLGHWLPIASALAVSLVWAALSGHAEGYGEPLSPSWDFRLAHLPDAILGGYQDSSELLLLGLAGIAFLALTAHALPVTRARWSGLSVHERILYGMVACNIVLYFVLPQDTRAAKLIHFRHAVLAAMLLPVLARTDGGSVSPLLRRSLLGLLGVTAAGNAWVHLRAFSREASGFAQVAKAVPPRSRVLSLSFEKNGEVMKTFPYLHFGGYLQAERGGLVSLSFPEYFWNLPVQAREGATPRIPPNFEWEPWTFDYEHFGRHYQYVLVRSLEPVTPPPPTAAFPYALVLAEPPWFLYRAVAGASSLPSPGLTGP